MKIKLFYTNVIDAKIQVAFAKTDDDDIIWVSKWYNESDDPIIDYDYEEWCEEFLHFVVEDPRRLLVPVLPLFGDNRIDVEHPIAEFDEYDSSKILLLNKKFYKVVVDEEDATKMNFNYHYELKEFDEV